MTDAPTPTPQPPGLDRLRELADKTRAWIASNKGAAAGIAALAAVTIGGIAYESTAPGSPKSPSLLAAPTAPPCQWNYAYDANNVATATYCGNVVANGLTSPLGSMASLKGLAVPSSPTASQSINGYYVAGDLPQPETFIWNAGSNATDDACTVINPTGNAGPGRWLLVFGQELEVRQCGAKEDNASDDYAAVQAAIAALNAKASSTTPVTLRIDYGIAAIASINGIPGGLFKPAPYFIIQCRNPLATGMRITGSNVITTLIEFDNPQANYVKNCRIGGNSVNNPADASSAGAVFFDNLAGAPQANNFGVIDDEFDNFSSTYWVYTRNDSSSPMRYVRYSGNQFFTFSGNDPNPNAIVHPADLMAVIGQISNLGGVVGGVSIDKNDADGTYVKRCATIWSGVQNVVITNNTFRNCAANAGAAAGPYTILIYNSDPGSIGAAPPDTITVADNHVTGINGNGVYCASCRNVRVVHNQFNDQNNSDVSLPHFAVTLNGLQGASLIQGNSFLNDLQNIYVNASGGGYPTEASILIADNSILSNKANANGIQMTVNVNPPITDAQTQYTAQNNVVWLPGASSTGFGVFSSNAATLGVVTLIGNRVYATNQCERYYDTVSPFLLTARRVFIGGGESCEGIVVGSANGTFIATSATTPITIDGLVMDGVSFCGSCTGLVLNAVTNLRATNLTFRNFNGGAVAYTAPSSQGALQNVQFVNSTGRVGSGLGTAAPTWSANQGTFVQNLSPTGAGALHGWTNTNGTTGWTAD